MTFIEHWQQRKIGFFMFFFNFFFCELFFVHFLQLRMTLICCVCSSDNVSLSCRTILYVMALCGVRWSIQIIQFVAVRIHRIEHFLYIKCCILHSLDAFGCVANSRPILFNVIVGVCCYSVCIVNFHVYFVPVFCYIQRFFVFSLISSVNRVYLFWPKYLIVAQSPISHLMISKSPVKITIIIFTRTSNNPQFLIRNQNSLVKFDLACPA